VAPDGAPNDEALYGHPPQRQGPAVLPLAAGIQTRVVHGTLTPLLNELTKEIIDRPQAPSKRSPPYAVQHHGPHDHRGFPENRPPAGSR
jgi:hypothetical protein